ncbi:cysteine desulfurase family protein [Brenneria rubrifaciens]|uniref:Cysteine desulfurase n=1 Tax=Brenneria rubrifaciens TaxID=55213 RepID=A0A4P8QMI1_9GAMM|nr:cysteine desulfurase family protein [Brenneria rubrifaciens]QCR08372.1 cysteine desulfurase [Brenneria rubrifaciens]
MSGLYFDHNATTPLSPGVKRAIQEAMDIFANPSGSHQFSFSAKAMITEARTSVAQLLGTPIENIVFTSGGTESNNLALGSILNTAPEGSCAKCHIICSSIEHPSVLNILRCYQQQGGALTIVDPDKTGRVSALDIQKALRPNTRLIVLMAVNNETGVIQPFVEVSRIAARENVYLHVDAVQAVGKIPINCRHLTGISTLSFSGHKFNAPKGIGGLYYAPNINLRPNILGGGQEYGLRSGTENTLGLAGLSVAAKEAYCDMVSRYEICQQMRDRFLERLNKLGIRYIVNGSPHPDNQTPWTMNISFPGIRAESLASRLDLCYGISLSLSSACSNNTTKRRSYVLSSMGLSDENIDGALRISLGHTTSAQDILLLADALAEESSHLYRMAGFNIN